MRTTFLLVVGSVSRIALLRLSQRLVGITAVRDKCEVKLLPVEVGTRHLHLHLVSESILIVEFSSDKAIVLLIEVIIVVGKDLLPKHESLTLILVKFNVESPFCHSGNHARINLSESVLHELHLLVAYRRAFGISSEPAPCRRNGGTGLRVSVCRCCVHHRHIWQEDGAPSCRDNGVSAM